MTVPAGAPGWHAVDGAGLDVATGRPPRGPGAPSPVAALAAMPVSTWPLELVSSTGSRHRVADALGRGGEAVAGVVDGLARYPTPSVGPAGVAARLAATPAGWVDAPVSTVPLARATALAGAVDRDWLAVVEGRRAEARHALAGAGRSPQLEAALHIGLLVATERLDPDDDTHVDAHVASGAQLWLLGGALAWALAEPEANPFGPWAGLVAEGWWPVGLCGGRLVMARATAPTRSGAA